MKIVRSLRLLVTTFVVALSGCASESPLFQLDLEQAHVLEDTPFYPQQTDQCGPASLAMLLSASGSVVTPDDLVPYTFLPGRKGSLQLGLISTCRYFNRIPYIIDPNINSLLAELKAGRPVLVLQNLGLNILPAYHYAVVIGVIPPEKIVLHSGKDKRLVMDIDDFLRTWKKTSSWGMIALRPGELPVNPDRMRYLNAVNAFELGGNVVGAARGYEAASTAWPEDQTALFAIGNNYLLQKKHKEAESIFRDLIQNNPDNIAAINNLAETFARQGCYLKALEVINRAVNSTARLNSPLKKNVLQTRNEIIQNLNATEQDHLESCNDVP